MIRMRYTQSFWRVVLSPSGILREAWFVPKSTSNAIGTLIGEVAAALIQLMAFLLVLPFAPLLRWHYAAKARKEGLFLFPGDSPRPSGHRTEPPIRGPAPLDHE